MKLRRSLPAFVASAALAVSLSGCGVAARLLATAGAASTVHDLVEMLPEATQPPTPLAAGDATVRATVTGTNGAGLRLNERPGDHRLAVFPEQTEVVIVCDTKGPVVSGPSGSTSVWSRVTTPDGRTGYMSDAYLHIDREIAPRSC
jgi:hypothetical protein